jgi:hypothetical protein
VVLVVLAGLLGLVDLASVAVEVWVEAVDLVLVVDMDRVENMMVDLYQFDRILPQRVDILFVIGEDHLSSLLTPTILL